MNKQNNLPEATAVDIQDLTQGFFDNGVMFTKYDVTKQLRHNGFWAKHRDVRRVVEQMDTPDDYSVTLERVAGKMAELYHPDTADISGYDPNDVAAFQVDNGSSGDGTSSSSTTKSGGSIFDKRNRYSVRAKVVRNAGFAIGAVVSIKTQSGMIIVEAGPVSGGRNAMVDCYYNIRVPKRDFENAFDTIPDEVDVTVSKGKIEITE